MASYNRRCGCVIPRMDGVLPGPRLFALPVLEVPQVTPAEELLSIVKAWQEPLAVSLFLFLLSAGICAVNSFNRH